MRALRWYDFGRRRCCKGEKYLLTAYRRIAWDGRGGPTGGCKQGWDSLQSSMTLDLTELLPKYVTAYSAVEGGFHRHHLFTTGMSTDLI